MHLGGLLIHTLQYDARCIKLQTEWAITMRHTNLRYNTTEIVSVCPSTCVFVETTEEISTDISVGDLHKNVFLCKLVPHRSRKIHTLHEDQTEFCINTLKQPSV